MPRGISTQVLGGFKTGMDRQTKRGGRDGAQRLYTLENAYLNERGDAVPRPGLQHVANVAHSSGLYGWQGQLHVFHGESDFVDPGNPLVAGHWVRYPYVEQPLTLSGDLGDGVPGQAVDFQYTVSNGVPPYVVSIVAGALPAGLSMDAAGHVTGTRTAFGSYTWTVRATDADEKDVDLPDASSTLDTFMYVSHSTQNKIYALQKSTGALLATIPVGVTASGVAINPAGTRVYVANASANTVSVINTATNAVIATIAVGTNPVDICVSKDGTRGYTANQSSSTVSVLDLTNNTLITTVAKGSAPFACNTNPVNGDIYIVSAGNSTVYLLNADGSTKASVAFTNPSGCAASPDGLYFYVVGFAGLTAFDATTHASLGNINLRGGYGPQDVEITPDGKTAYVADYNYTDLKVVNVSNKSAMSVITSIAGVGKSSRIAMDAVGVKAYVEITGVGTVVIDVATNTIETTYPYGNFGVAVGMRVAP